MASLVLAERAAQRPVVEEPEEEIPLEPQQTGNQTSVPEQLVEKAAEQSTSALSTNPAEAGTLVPKEPVQAEEQQPGLAQSTLADAMARGKAIVVVETADSRPVPPPEQEAEEDEVEEILGRPQDKRQHVYVSRWWNDEWVYMQDLMRP